MRKKYPYSSMSKMLFLLSIVCLVSCKPQKVVDPDVIVINDSTMIDLSHYTIKKIRVGDFISNKPLSSQLVQIGGKEKYLLMDNGYIYQFDWDSGTLEDSIPTAQCGGLSNFSGFTCLNADTVLVYNDGARTLSFINGKGEILQKFEIPASQGTSDMKPTVEALNTTRPLRQNGRIILSGAILGNLEMAGELGIKAPVTEYVEMQTGGWTTTVYYPEKYTQYNWGSYYLNQVSVAQDSTGHFLYSFPVCPYVLRYDSDFTSCDTLPMRSRYDKGIVECDLTPEDFDEDPDKEIRYYISQTSYSYILYDAYRRLYLRLVEHPLKDWPGKVSFCKPISVIVADMDGNVLSESKIASLGEKVFYDNMHVFSGGLAIAIDNPDENNIYFACIPIEKR